MYTIRQRLCATVAMIEKKTQNAAKRTVKHKNEQSVWCQTAATVALRHSQGVSTAVNCDRESPPSSLIRRRRCAFHSRVRRVEKAVISFSSCCCRSQSTTMHRHCSWQCLHVSLVDAMTSRTSTRQLQHLQLSF